jgi:hypothetical protein
LHVGADTARICAGAAHRYNVQICALQRPLRATTLTAGLWVVGSLLRPQFGPSTDVASTRYRRGTDAFRPKPLRRCRSCSPLRTIRSARRRSPRRCCRTLSATHRRRSQISRRPRCVARRQAASAYAARRCDSIGRCLFAVARRWMQRCP